MKRRKFLRGIGSILTLLGVTEAGWLQLGDCYQQALAMPTNRKLALLVGVNQYNQSPALAGCLTDVELQRELLIHRFGFQPSDILPLTEQQATRQVIETAFNEHLIKQARPGDVVFFHFSGYGSRVQLATSLEKAQNALVTIDDSFSTQNGKNINLILEETLRLLLRSLPTKYVTAVLDTSFNAANIRPSGLRIRNYPQVFPATVLDAELDLQKQLSQKALNELPGFLLTATSGEQQLAMEGLFSGFSAGLFTYALTQHLWESTSATTIQVSLSQAASTILTLGGQQQPQILNHKQANHLLPERETAVGAIINVEDNGKTAQVWLGGLPPQVLEYVINSRFVLATDNLTKIVLRSRSGLTAKAQTEQGDTSLQVGQLVRESIRVLPRNLNLSVALDSRLERIERVDAISAFATVAHVSSVIEGEQPADCIFGRNAPRTSDSTSPSRYGLFSLGHELTKSTVGEPGEAVKVAVHRLVPDLQKLLGVKLWRLTANEGSSLLAVKATLEIVSTLEPLIQRETVRILNPLLPVTSREQSANVPTLAIGTRIQYRVQNQSDRPIYLMLLGLDSNRKAIALYPGRPMEEANTIQQNLFSIMLSVGASAIIPQTASGAGWVIQDSVGQAETQLIFSIAPFTQTLAALEADKYPREQHQINKLLNPLEVAQALLQDLHNASGLGETIAPSDNYVLDVNAWASLNFVYQVS